MKLGWGIVGTGGAADTCVAPGIERQADSRIVAAFDVDADRAAAFATRHGGVRLHRDLDGLLEDPEVGIVYIATPNAIHAQQVIAAAKAGKHVLCEKPMALSLQDGRAMVAAMKEAGRLLGVGFHMRHKPSNLAARKMIQEGNLGRIFFADIERGSTKESEVFPWDTWRSEPALAGGGTIFNQGLHPIDTLHFITGSKIVNISAKVDCQPIEDVFAAVCELDNGALATIASHQLWPNTRPDYIVCGEKGWVCGVGAAYGRPGDHLEVHDKNGQRIIKGSDRSPYWDEVEDFVQAVLGKAPLNGDGEDGLYVIAVVEAIYRSVREKRSVKVEPLW